MCTCVRPCGHLSKRASQTDSEEEEGGFFFFEWEFAAKSDFVQRGLDGDTIDEVLLDRLLRGRLIFFSLLQNLKWVLPRKP